MNRPPHKYKEFVGKKDKRFKDKHGGCLTFYLCSANSWAVSVEGMQPSYGAIFEGREPPRDFGPITLVDESDIEPVVIRPHRYAMGNPFKTYRVYHDRVWIQDYKGNALDGEPLYKVHNYHFTYLEPVRESLLLEPIQAECLVCGTWQPPIDMKGICYKCVNHMEALEAENQRLKVSTFFKKALKRYGRHERIRGCKKDKEPGKNYPCTCGLDEAPPTLEALKKYGEHRMSCPKLFDSNRLCECGFDKLIQ